MSKILLLLSTFLFAALISFSFKNKLTAAPIDETANCIPTPSTAETTKIQVALLLDTSNSMDGLIEQAKSRLWNIINTLSTLKYEGKAPKIEIALYEYGNDGISRETNYVRLIAPFGTGLDNISEKLFALRTNGGEEYCGAVINKSLSQLEWDSNKNSMKLIYIAGNEPFNQGPINYKEAISSAIHKDVFINTIFCGNAMEGINSFWKDGADVGKGEYFNIDPNQKVIYIVTPYDDEISRYNIRLNKTYIIYGSAGRQKQENQWTQDSNAGKMSPANAVERTVSKSKAAYDNSSWDMVDSYKSDKRFTEKLDKESIPEELKGKSKDEIRVYVENKSKEREEILQQINVLAKKRQDYIDGQSKVQSNGDDLGNAINKSILNLAKQKNYK
jgi:von Willebrand factor type A domain